MNAHDTQSSNPSSESKLPYRQPVLVRYGSLAELTRSGFGSKKESSAGKGSSGQCNPDSGKRPC